MKARWFWSRWLLPPCDDEIHHSCREAERTLQACGEEIVMTAVNIISFYFHTTDIMFSLRHRQGFPCFCLPCSVTQKSQQCRACLWLMGSSLVSLVLIPLVGWSFLVFTTAPEEWLAGAAGERRWLELLELLPEAIHMKPGGDEQFIVLNELTTPNVALLISIAPDCHREMICYSDDCFEKLQNDHVSSSKNVCN